MSSEYDGEEQQPEDAYTRMWEHVDDEWDFGNVDNGDWYALEHHSLHSFKTKKPDILQGQSGTSLQAPTAPSTTTLPNTCTPLPHSTITPRREPFKSSMPIYVIRRAHMTIPTQQHTWRR